MRPRDLSNVVFDNPTRKGLGIWQLCHNNYYANGKWLGVNPLFFYTALIYVDCISIVGNQI